MRQFTRYDPERKILRIGYLRNQPTFDRFRGALRTSAERRINSWLSRARNRICQKAGLEAGWSA